MIFHQINQLASYRYQSEALGLWDKDWIQGVINTTSNPQVPICGFGYKIGYKI